METTYPGMMLGHEPDGSTWQDYIGFVDGRLRYITVPTSLTMEWNSGIQERRKVINRVIKFVEAQQQSIPVELGHLTYDGGIQFLWADMFEALRASLFEGLAICFPLAFVVLLYSTENLLVALYAIVGIALIVASVLGTIEYVYGWDLGIVESLMGNLVVGFSVDYTIHLGHMFVAAGREYDLQNSLDRFSFAIRKMGGTVEYVYGWDLGIVESLMGRERRRRRRRRLIDRRVERSGPQLPVARRVEVRADLRLGARADELCDAPVVERPELLHACGAHVLLGLGPAAAVRRRDGRGRFGRSGLHGGCRTRRPMGARLFRLSQSTNGAARGSTQARPRPA